LTVSLSEIESVPMHPGRHYLKSLSGVIQLNQLTKLNILMRLKERPGSFSVMAILIFGQCQIQ